jgi:Zn-dependent peptidase ImmA (M78 family)/transcriptional regulator with XRE-family HTH domain
MALFDPRRLALARSAAGKTKSDLARDLDLSPASISQYEAGNTSPRAAVVAEMALVLGVHPRYFEQTTGRRQVSPASRSFFRSLRATRQWERDEADALSEHVYDVVFFIESRVTLPSPDVPSLPVRADASRGDVEQVAATLRQHWDVAAGRPIANVVRLMESRGVFVCRPPAVSTRVDAFSRWFDARPLVVLSDGKRDKARSRFDAAHELGHLVMHHEPEFSDRVQERQAHAFAAAILMPAAEVMEDLPNRPPRGGDWERLKEAQQRWGVSIAALLYRAKELGTLSDATFRRAMTRYNELRLGTHDGTALGTPESPRLLPEAVQTLMSHNHWTYDDFAAELRFTPRQLEAILGPTNEASLIDAVSQVGVLVQFPRPVGDTAASSNRLNRTKTRR